MPLFRKQSAAVLPSLAPHDSKARLQAVTNRRDSWRSHVHRTYIAQRVQPFKLQTVNVGGRGALPSPFSGGFKGGILFGKRIPPLVPQRARRSPSRARAGKSRHPFGTPRERLRLAVQSLNDLCASGMRLPARGVAALGVARRFASAPIIRCRSAHLVEVQPNFRLPEHSTMRRAQQCRYFARSLPPSKRHTRLTTVRRGCKT